MSAKSLSPLIKCPDVLPELTPSPTALPPSATRPSPAALSSPPSTIPDSVTAIGDRAFDGRSRSPPSCLIRQQRKLHQHRRRLVKQGTHRSTKRPGGFSGAYTIPDGVTSIDNAAFYGLRPASTSVTIPSTASPLSAGGPSPAAIPPPSPFPTGVIAICYCAFVICAGSTSVIIGNSVTHIGECLSTSAALSLPSP